MSMLGETRHQLHRKKHGVQYSRLNCGQFNSENATTRLVTTDQFPVQVRGDRLKMFTSDMVIATVWPELRHIQ
jgi:hypothetical protein